MWNALVHVGIQRDFLVSLPLSFDIFENPFAPLCDVFRFSSEAS